MILLSFHIILISVFYLSVAPLFNPAFDLLHIPSGSRTIALQCLNFTICAIFFCYRKAFNNKVIKKEIILTVFVWIPWLVFLYLRTDLASEYSVLKAGKIFFIHFLSVITLTIFHLFNPEQFNKYFIAITIFLCGVLLVFSVLAPSVFLYDARIERLTLENVNPIWLARSFAIGIVCCLFVRGKYKTLTYILIPLFFGFMVLTGSRGPLLSVFLVLLAYFLFSKGKGLLFYVKFIFAAAILLSLSIGFSAHLQRGFHSYFKRATNKDVMEESGRLMLFGAALKDFQNSPVVGVGLGKFYQNKSKTGFPTASRHTTANIYPHNLVLEILAELGLVGVLLSLLILRPGIWLFRPTGIYFYLFYLSFFFSLTSGDMIANTGVFLFSTLCRLDRLKLKSDPVRLSRKTEASAGNI